MSVLGSKETSQKDRESLSLRGVNQSPAQPISVLWRTEFPQHPQRKLYFLKGKLPRRLMVTARNSQAAVMPAIENVKNANTKLGD